VHGNCYNAQKKVSVAVEVDNNRLIIRVQDQGAGFDPNEIPDPLANENLMRKSGRGLFLMRAFMDELQVNRLRPEGMEIVMIKNTTPSASQEEEAK
jgi:serine/threonine-protein kinase RsbW